MSFTVVMLSPALEFIDSLDDKMQAKILRTLHLLKNTGPMLRLPHSKKITGQENLLELRVQFGNNIVRMCYFHAGGVTYVITSGYVKKDQKLDASEIARAIKYKAIFEKEANK